MADAEQLKALFRSHASGDDEHFHSIALQMAALEARKGHGKLAEELRAFVDAAKQRRGGSKTVALHQPKGDLGLLLEASYPTQRLVNLVVDDSLREQLARVVREQKHVAHITANGLSPRRKLLLVGPPGTGKTLTASALAGDLGLPLFQVRLDVLITKFMGETAGRLRQVFDAVLATRGVYFFDEFDAIGSQRGLHNDVGEARRILNSFLQMLEQDGSHSLILAATNHQEILDFALLRRFDDVLRYRLPSAVQIKQLLLQRLGQKLPSRPAWSRLTKQADGLSFAEITKAADDAQKDALLSGQAQVDMTQLLGLLAERRAMRESWAAHARPH